MPREKLDQWHLQRIQRLIKFAYDHTSLYRRLYDQAGFKPEDIKTWDDFYHKVPYTDKPDFVRDQREQPFAAQTMGQEHMLYYFQTTGTTGEFLRESYTLYDTVKSGDHYCYGFWDVGIRPGDSFYFCFNWGLWVGLWHIYWNCRNMGCVVYSGGGLSTEERLRHIMNLRPTVVTGTPTYLLHMLNVARSLGLDLRQSGVRFLTGGGEPGFNVPVTRQALEEGWGARVVECYGLSEPIVGHHECSARPGGVHVIESCFHAFSADPESGEPLGDGQIGENIVTSYAHTMQPFIKYRTHDLVERYQNPDHGCGWTWAFLKGGVLGRTDFMVVIRGVNVYPTAVENLLGQVPGVTPYYEMHLSREQDMDRMLVKVEAKEDVQPSSYSELAREVEEVYKKNIGVKLEVEVVPPQTLPRYELKTRRIFDHRPKEVRRALDRQS
jgi:phenylacetate-CoA ligase